MQAVPIGFARARAIHRRCVALLCVVLAPAAAQSQTFPPPNAWTALERNGQTIVDPAFDLAVIQSARDIVGCAPSPRHAVTRAAAFAGRDDTHGERVALLAYWTAAAISAPASVQIRPAAA